jgi:DNA-binding response OmpR family regulator
MQNDGMTARKRVMIISHGTRSDLKLADWLASDGYEVAIARRADEAVEQLSAMQPDGIVLDRHLPIANGLAVLRLIQLQCPQVPVFTCSETTGRIPKSGARSRSAGMPSLLLTPLEGSVMGALLDAHVRA